MILYFIADIGSNHDGDLNRAKMLIKQAKLSGANAVKFQLFKAESIINDKAFAELGKLEHQEKWKDSIYNTFKKYEISEDWIPELKKECDKNKIDFMCTPYYLKAVKLLNDYVDVWKIGSGDITYWSLIEAVAKTGKKIILGTGASEWQEVRSIRNKIKEINKDLHLVQCNTNYKKTNKNYKYLNLQTIKTEGYQGISDHSQSCVAVLGAIMIAYNILKTNDIFYIEKHLTDGKSESPDNDFALSINDYKNMVDISNNLIEAIGDGVKRIEYNEQETHSIQRRSWYVCKTLKQGEIITEKDIIALRPYNKNGFSPNENIIGLKVNKNLQKFDLISREDIC